MNGIESENIPLLVQSFRLFCCLYQRIWSGFHTRYSSHGVEKVKGSLLYPSLGCSEDGVSVKPTEGDCYCWTYLFYMRNKALIWLPCGLHLHVRMCVHHSWLFLNAAVQQGQWEWLMIRWGVRLAWFHRSINQSISQSGLPQGGHVKRDKLW